MGAGAMKNSKAVKLVTGTVIILFVIMIMFLYMKNLDSAMKEDIIVALNEIGKHDIKSIEKEVQNCWDVLEGISDNLMQLQCETISELQTNLVVPYKAERLNTVWKGCRFQSLPCSARKHEWEYNEFPAIKPQKSLCN